MKRPTDAELVKLLRRSAELANEWAKQCSRDDHDGDSRTLVASFDAESVQLSAAADALEAASAAEGDRKADAADEYTDENHRERVEQSLARHAALSAEPFEAKVERAARAVYEATRTPMSASWNSSTMESSRTYLCEMARISLRAAGVQ